MPACIGKCGSEPYKYVRAAEEAEILNMFNRVGGVGSVVCPDNVEVRDRKASFICKVSYNNGTVQNYQIDIDNGSRGLRNAN